MLELAVRNQTSESWSMLDTLGINMELVFAIGEVADFTKRTSPHSLSFDLPMSPINNKFFGLDADIDASMTLFDWTKETSGEILDAGVPILTGTLQVVSFDLNLRVYQCMFYGENADVYLRWQGRTWRDVFTDTNDVITTDLNHILSAQNVLLSWTGDITLGQIGSGVIIYPLLDRGLTNTDYEQFSGFYGAGGQYNTGIFNSHAQQSSPEQLDGFLMVQTLRPAIQLKYLFNQLANYAGYNITSGGFLDGYSADKLYMTLGTDKELQGSVVAGFYVSLEGTYTNLSGPDISGAWFSDLLFSDQGCVNCYDPADWMSAGQFAPTESGYYNFGYGIEINAGGTATSIETTLLFEWYLNGELYNTIPLTYIVGGGVQTFGEQNYLSNSMQVNFGDVVSWRLVGYNTSAYPLSIVNSGTYIILQYDDTNYPQAINTIAMFDNGTVSDWIASVFEQFNLIMTSDPLRKELTILTYDDYMDAGGDPVDWTQKLDISKGFNVKPMTDYLTRQVMFKDKQGKDIGNNWWELNINKVIGQFYYDASTSAFLREEKTIGDYFIPFRNSYIPTAFNGSYIPVDSSGWSNIRVMRMWNEYTSSGVRDSKNTASLFFFHGTQPTLDYAGNSISYYLRNVSWYINVTSTNRHPSTDVLSNTSNDENLGYMLTWKGRIVHDDKQGKTKGLYEQFYQGMMVERYHIDAKVAECTMYLTPDDVREIQYNKRVFVQGTYWYVERISNYRVGSNNPCRVTLRKFLGDPSSFGNVTRNCDLTPIIDRGGQVYFTDGATTSAGNSTCCLENDYYWDNTNQTCWWNWNGGNDGGVGDHGEPKDHDVNAVAQNAWLQPLLTGDAHRLIQRQYQTELPVETQSFEMNAITNAAQTVNAKSLGGVTELRLLPDAQYNLEVFVTARSARTNGTSIPLLDNVKYVQSIFTTGMATQSSTTGSDVFKDDNNSGLTVSVVAGTGLDGQPKFQIRCTDAFTVTGEKSWTLRVEATISPTQARTSLPAPTIANAQYQDYNFIGFQDGNALEWNS